MLVPGGPFATGWTGYAPLASHQPLGQVFFNMGVQWAGASSIMTALNFLVTIITMRAPGHDVLAHAAPRLGELHDLAARRPGDAVHRRLAVLRDVRPGHAHPLLRPGRRRVRAGLPAHLLVLLAPGRVHHDAARLRDRLRDHLDVRAQADLRLPADGVLARRHPHPRLLRLGAPHVRGRNGAVATRADDGDDAPDRDPDRHQGLQLARDLMGGADQVHHADAVRARLRRQLPDRRPVRDLPRLGADRHPRLRHVLHRRAHPLRALRRLADDDLRRALLLVSEDDRPDVRRAAREVAFLADADLLQRHVLPDALHRPAGDAAPRRRLRAALRGHQHVHLDLLRSSSAPRRCCSSTT